MPIRPGKTTEVMTIGCGVKLNQRIALLDRRIRTTANSGAGIKQRTPGVCAGEALLAETGWREEKIADRVRGLHRGDNPLRRKARDIFMRDDLSVLDAKARIAQRLRIIGERVAIGV